MFTVTKTRLAAGAAAIALAGSGIGLTVATAGASTAGCTGITTGPEAGSCGDLVAASGYGLAAQAGRNGAVAAGAAIVGSNAVTTSTTTDFYAHQTNGNDSQRVLEYAPGGVLSDLCVTEQTASAGLVLEYCNGATDQEFYGIGDTQNDTGNTNGGLEWLNAATSRVIDINRTSVTMDTLTTSSTNSDTYLHWAG